MIKYFGLRVDIIVSVLLKSFYFNLVLYKLSKFYTMNVPAVTPSFKKEINSKLCNHQHKENPEMIIHINPLYIENYSHPNAFAVCVVAAP